MTWFALVSHVYTWRPLTKNGNTWYRLVLLGLPRLTGGSLEITVAFSYFHVIDSLNWLASWFISVSLDLLELLLHSFGIIWLLLISGHLI